MTSDLQVGVGKRSIAEAKAKRPLHVHDRVIVVGAFHGLTVLGHLVVVGMQGVDVLGIGEGQLAGEILVTRKEGSEGIGAIVGGQHHVYHGGSQRLNISDETGTALAEHQHDGLSESSQFTDQFLLVRRQVKVVHVAGRLAVGVLTHAGYNDVGSAGSGNGLGNAGSIFLLPLHGGLVIHHAGLVGHVREAGLEGLHNGIVLRNIFVGGTLPAVAPATVKGTKAVGIGTGYENLLVLRERQDAVILEQDLALQGGLIRLAGKLRCIEAGIFRLFPHRMLKQAQTHLQAQHAADGVIEAGLGDAAFLHQLYNHVAAHRVIGIHDHVNTGIDTHGHSLFFVGGHVVADVEVVNVGPVGHQHAVPVQLLFHPAGEKKGIGVRRNTVDGSRVHHSGERAGAEALQERSEELLAKVVLGDVGRCAVLARGRNAVTHKVLDGNGHVLLINMVGVCTLQGQRLLTGHLGLQIRVFTEALPDTGPAGIASQVHHRREHPRHLRGAGLISHGNAHLPGKLAVEGSAQVNLLRVQGAFIDIGRAVNHIQAIDAGNANGLHGLFLNLTHHGGRMLAGVCSIVHHIEDGTNFIMADDTLQFGGIDGLMRIVFQGGYIELDQLAGLFFQSHFGKHTLHLGLNGLVGGNGG